MRRWVAVTIAALAPLLAGIAFLLTRPKPPPPSPTPIAIARAPIDAGAEAAVETDPSNDMALHLKLGGVVVANGQPVKGATVELGDDVTLTTDAEGRFQSPVVARTDFANAQVDVEATQGDLFGSIAVFGPHDRLDLRIELRPRAPLRVSVRDSDGRPVRNASIEAMSELGAEDDQVHDRPMQLTDTAQTDARGEVTLRLRPDIYTVTATWNDGPPVERQGVRLVDAGSRLELTVSRYSLRGYVVTRSGQPVPGATVELYSHGERVSGTAEQFTDDEGAFAYAGLPPGTYEMRVPSSSGGSGAATFRVPSSGVKLVLDTENEITGRVVDEHGVPQAEAIVRPRNTDLETTTRKDGTFALATPPGTYRLVANPEALLYGAAEVTLAPHGRAKVTIVVHHGGALKGSVVDTQGKPVTGVDVSATVDEPDADLEDGSGTGVSAKGTFEISPVSPGRYKLTIDDERWVLVAPVTAQGGDSKVKLVVDRVPTLRGRVVNAAGSPIRRFTINGIDEHTAADGRFEIPLETPPRAILYIEAGALGDAAFVVPPGPGHGPTELGDLAVSPARMVVTVVDAIRRPLPHVDLSFSLGGTRAVPYVGSGYWRLVTDAKGECELPRIIGDGVSVIADVDGATHLVRPVPSGATAVKLVAGPGTLVH